jgi:hypothetical protein
MQGSLVLQRGDSSNFSQSGQPNVFEQQSVKNIILNYQKSCEEKRRRHLRTFFKSPETPIQRGMVKTPSQAISPVKKLLLSKQPSPHKKVEDGGEALSIVNKSEKMGGENLFKKERQLSGNIKQQLAGLQKDKTRNTIFESYLSTKTLSDMAR